MKKPTLNDLSLIGIRMIKHQDQRYPTLGDWQITQTDDDKVSLHIRISDTKNGAANACLAIHELVEAVLCLDRGITDKEVDAFDIDGPGKDLADPGSDPRAPYHREHNIACYVEDILRTNIYLDQKMYDEICDQTEKIGEYIAESIRGPNVIRTFAGPIVKLGEANAKQIGGDHYKSKEIQPWDFVAANGLGFFEGNAIKYITRHREKGGVDDLKKAIHYLEKLIELSEGIGE